jgi:hypothetical protein
MPLVPAPPRFRLAPPSTACQLVEWPQYGSDLNLLKLDIGNATAVMLLLDSALRRHRPLVVEVGRSVEEELHLLLSVRVRDNGGGI